MRGILLSLCVLCCALAWGGENRPELVETALNRVFVPTGFDSNDRVQVVVAGEFVNTCYQVGPYRVNVDEKAKRIVVTQTAYYYGGTCLDVTVPFNHEVELGMLEAGTYTVVDAASSWKLGTIEVNEATRPEVDDAPYAPVEDAFIVKDGTTGMPALVFWGALRQDCYEVSNKTVEPRVYKDVLVVRPLLRKTKEECNNGYFPFRVTHVFESKLPKTFLLHVRAMNGEAINKIISPMIN